VCLSISQVFEKTKKENNNNNKTKNKNLCEILLAATPLTNGIIVSDIYFNERERERQSANNTDTRAQEPTTFNNNVPAV